MLFYISYTILQERINLNYSNKDIVEVERRIFYLTLMLPGKLWKLSP